MISIEGIRAKWSDYLTTWEDPRDGKPDDRLQWLHNQLERTPYCRSKMPGTCGRDASFGSAGSQLTYGRKTTS